MKKFLLAGLAVTVMAGSAAAANPLFLTDFYTNSISPNGKWLVNDGSMGYMWLYNVPTNDMIVIDGEFIQGNGNCINNAGIVAGSIDDVAALIVNNKVVYPTAMEKYNTSDFHGITPDGTRVCGYVGNTATPTGESMVTYIPIVAEISAAGEVSKLIELPYPAKDLFENVPQYASAVCISNDGKTILGQVVDNSGMFVYPIVYTEGADGEWSYSLPTAKYFNPDHLPLPVYPGEFTLMPPDFKDYMTTEERTAYEAAYNAWVESGYTAEYPEMGNFMTEAEIEAYNKAADEFNALAMEYNEKLNAYFTEYNAIVEKSINFIRNTLVLTPDAQGFISTSIREEEVGEWMIEQIYENYLFDLKNDSYTILPNAVNNQILANQILPNGVIIGSTPVSMFSAIPPQSYVYEPGAADFVPLQEYLRVNNPELAAWMTENLTAKIEVDYDPETWDPIYEEMVLSGHAVASDDMKVISGGVMAFYFETGELSQSTYASYLFTDVTTVGVEAVSAEALNIKALKGGILKIDGEIDAVDIYDVAGSRVYHGENLTGTVETGLAGGMYIVKAADKSMKVIF